MPAGICSSGICKLRLMLNSKAMWRCTTTKCHRDLARESLITGRILRCYELIRSFRTKNISKDQIRSVVNLQKISNCVLCTM